MVKMEPARPPRLVLELGEEKGSCTGPHFPVSPPTQKSAIARTHPRMSSSQAVQQLGVLSLVLAPGQHLWVLAVCLAPTLPHELTCTSTPHPSPTSPTFSPSGSASSGSRSSGLVLSVGTPCSRLGSRTLRWLGSLDSFRSGVFLRPFLGPCFSVPQVATFTLGLLWSSVVWLP